jgi:hypothetical protein
MDRLVAEMIATSSFYHTRQIMRNATKVSMLVACLSLMLAGEDAQAYCGGIPRSGQVRKARSTQVCHHGSGH